MTDRQPLLANGHASMEPDPPRRSYRADLANPTPQPPPPPASRRIVESGKSAIMGVITVLISFAIAAAFLAYDLGLADGRAQGIQARPEIQAAWNECLDMGGNRLAAEVQADGNIDIVCELVRH